MKYWQEIESEIDKHNLKVDKEKIRMAFFFAEECHIGQYRKSGDSYIIHPVEVTKILIDMKMDTEGIIAGILHDIVEDTLITIADIKYNFGDEVAHLVDGVTKLDHLPNGTKKQDENIRKMIIAMAKDVRVIIIKLADRLHNMRTLKFMPPEKQKRIAQETLSIYAPLAHRLGIAKIKWELEDMSLHYLEPEKYKEIKALIDEKKDERKKYLEEMVNNITRLLNEVQIYAKVKGRFKHFYSIYKKMFEKGKDFDGIYDLIGIRIILNTEAECYNTLGVIHSNYRPVPGRFKDYIAVPKSNNYQSIHTTIVGPLGKFVEIQIRTEDMDRVAEEGVAAHWSYKENKKISKKDQVYGWLRNIVELNQGAENTEEFIKEVTGDIVKETVFVFSPKGDVVELAQGATPIDFAFNIHTEIGIKCVGAKVNGKIVPLDYKLNNGDRVEIITSKTGRGPGNDWLDIVATQSAKSKIKKWLKDQKFDENIKIGKELIEREVGKLGMTLKEFEESPTLKKHLEKHNIPTLNDFYFHMGETKSKIDVVVAKLKVEQEKSKAYIESNLEDFIKEPIKKKSAKKDDQGIVIDGTENTLIRFARCCTPLPGDEIGGYVTKLTGIAIHRKDCPNYISMVNHDPARVIDVHWDEKLLEAPSKKSKYTFAFTIKAMDRQNILMDVVTMISNHKINVLSLNSHNIKKGLDTIAIIKATVELNNKDEYKQLVSHLLKIKDVMSVER
ncbi:MAG: RelA/SpoT family protein [Cetobacterium sp.]|uniref:RelA/SpoT family protein n=1 Tax=Cetobacterium TaxID=180162 RepID=UPI001F05A2BB|nr:bifunctional (p)ppGpp synthetase/guanosine-3',5'-bis(diphosphate) 3'-pyrophosphohydrolase [Cetobacterium somerae]MCX3067852.1 bifunctional (p)ppGpp synthetase/guanosine-3',5'-bis(diphosphate) 3'-pyrophosphohydrolase [Cetobacterium somerae]UPO97852.1 bifunctional (p)ppGpp synthetase/guanosine-3',5'-bis(diphosphate) 3'-pyrophosphohydrolase [Cetobacterium somerae]